MEASPQSPQRIRGHWLSGGMILGRVSVDAQQCLGAGSLSLNTPRPLCTFPNVWSVLSFSSSLPCLILVDLSPHPYPQPLRARLSLLSTPSVWKCGFGRRGQIFSASASLFFFVFGPHCPCCPHFLHTLFLTLLSPLLISFLLHGPLWMHLFWD